MTMPLAENPELFQSEEEPCTRRGGRTDLSGVKMGTRPNLNREATRQGNNEEIKKGNVLPKGFTQ